MPNLKCNLQTPLILCLLGFYANFLYFLIYLSFVCFLLVKMAFCMSFLFHMKHFRCCFYFYFLSLFVFIGVLFGSFCFWQYFNSRFLVQIYCLISLFSFYILSTVKFFFVFTVSFVSLYFPVSCFIGPYSLYISIFF